MMETEKQETFHSQIILNYKLIFFLLGRCLLGYFQMALDDLLRCSVILKISQYIDSMTCSVLSGT